MEKVRKGGEPVVVEEWGEVLNTNWKIFGRIRVANID